MYVKLFVTIEAAVIVVLVVVVMTIISLCRLNTEVKDLTKSLHGLALQSRI